MLSFVLITTEANAMMRKIHNGGSNPFRMPKILTSEQERLWLDPTIVSKEAVTDLLTVYPEEEMTAWPVRPKFNYGDPYDEGIIEPVAEMQKLGLGTQSCLNHTKREETDNGLPSGNESRHSSNT